MKKILFDGSSEYIIILLKNLLPKFNYWKRWKFFCNFYVKTSYCYSVIVRSKTLKKFSKIHVSRAVVTLLEVFTLSSFDIDGTATGPGCWTFFFLLYLLITPQSNNTANNIEIRILQTTNDEVQRWSVNWRIKLNETKSVHINFTNITNWSHMRRQLNILAWHFTSYQKYRNM